MAGRLKQGIRRLGTVGIIFLISSATSSCARLDASSNAAQACAYVKRSMALLSESHAATTSAQAASERASALSTLRKGLPLAAQAAAGSGQYAPLSTTLSESNRVPEERLLPALRQECAFSSGGSAGNGTGGVNLPPPPPSGGSQG